MLRPQLIGNLVTAWLRCISVLRACLPELREMTRILRLKGFVECLHIEFPDLCIVETLQGKKSKNPQFFSEISLFLNKHELYIS